MSPTQPGRKRSKRPTITDVARESGVDISAVSRILNNRTDTHSYSEETRRRVLAACRRLHYSPNRAAQMLSSSRKGIIGIAMPYWPPNTENPAEEPLDIGISMVLHAARRWLQERQSDVLILPRYPERLRDELHLHARFCTELIDGLLVTTPDQDDDGHRLLAEEGYPVVLVGRDPSGARINTVDVDNYQTARLLTQRLLELGHRHIGYVWSIPDRLLVGHDRVNGFRDAMTGIMSAPVDRYVVGTLDGPRGGASALQQLLERKPPPTAIIADRLLPARGILQYARSIGLNAPDDFSLATFELEHTHGMHPTDEIGGVEIRVMEIFERATRRLFQIIDDPEGKPEEILIPTQPVDGTTIGPPPVRGGANGKRAARHQTAGA